MNHTHAAPTPPLGWNSWDCYGAAVTEAEIRGNADYMAEHLKEYGWQYITVDIQWYEPLAHSSLYRPFVPLIMDEYSTDASREPFPFRSRRAGLQTTG